MKRRIFFLLVSLFSLILVSVVSVGGAGVAMIDLTRAFLARERVQTADEKQAALNLYRYAATRDPVDYLAYEQQMSAPLAAAATRRSSETFERYWKDQEVLGRSVSPDFLHGPMRWIFAKVMESDLRPRVEQLWRMADRKLMDLTAAAGRLRLMVDRENPDQAAIDQQLGKISKLVGDLDLLRAAVIEHSEEVVRRFTGWIYLAIAGCGALMALVATVFFFIALRRMRHAAEAIAEREERFRDVAELAADWIWETDDHSQITYLSDRVTQATGFAKEDIFGHTPWDLPGVTFVGDWAEYRAAVERRERFEDFELNLSPPDGVSRIVHISGKPQFARDGRFLGYRGTGHNVTAEREARREADRRLEMIETGFEALGQGILVVDAGRRILMANRRLGDFLSIPDGGLAVGEDASRLLRHNVLRGEYGPGDVDEIVAGRRELLELGEALTEERVRPDGRIIEVRSRELRSGGFVIAYRDVTIRRKAQAAVEQSGRQLREVIDRSLDAYISIDHAEMVIDWNPAAERIFGWSRTAAIGRYLPDLVIPQRFHSAHQAALQRFPTTGKAAVAGTRREVTARRRDGSECAVELSVSASNVGGHVTYNSFLRDITERKQFEKRLLQAKEAAEVASRAKTDFLAHMSHELRTPLNAIIGFSEIMQQQKMGPLSERYASYALDIRNSGEHLLDLISDILDIASVESGKAQIEAVPVRIGRIFEACMPLLEGAARKNDITIVKRVAGDSAGLIGDPRRIRQILINLVDNALKFSKPHTTVTVSSAVIPEGLALEVSDEGIGMEKDKLEAVFQPFVQLRGSSLRAQEGSGLGLALVKRFVELHDGTIAIDSAPGDGTTVRMVFPRSRLCEGPEAPSGTGQIERPRRRA